MLHSRTLVTSTTTQQAQPFKPSHKVLFHVLCRDIVVLERGSRLESPKLGPSHIPRIENERDKRCAASQCFLLLSWRQAHFRTITLGAQFAMMRREHPNLLSRKTTLLTRTVKSMANQQVFSDSWIATRSESVCRHFNRRRDQSTSVRTYGFRNQLRRLQCLVNRYREVVVSCALFNIHQCIRSNGSPVSWTQNLAEAGECNLSRPFYS